MEVARDHTTSVNSNQDSTSTKDLVADADAKHEESKSEKAEKKEEVKEEKEE